jgi:Cu/Ag efflux protein CusF
MIMRSDAVASLVAATMLWSAAAAPAGPVCDVERAPGQQVARKAEGRVVKIDRAAGKVTLRQPDGKSHEYLASQATLREFKEGDSLEIKVKQPRTC